jgi:hypothetical protein
MSSSWVCGVHGAVAPLQVPHPPTGAWLADVATRSSVPVWVPWPLPAGWLLTGVAEVGAQTQGPVGTVVACSGPNPAPHPDVPAEHPSDLLLVAESPGVGLGAHLAGLEHVDPGDAVAVGRPDAAVTAAGQHTPLWAVDGAGDRVAFVGESRGVWLWLLLWPASAAVLLLESLELVDVRDGGPALDPPTGAPSPRLL